MRKLSAGLLVFRTIGEQLEVLLVHPGGPFWAKKDDGAWSIPKGEFEETEDPLAAAKREFEEETGFIAEGDAIPLEPLPQRSGKLVYAWAMAGDFDAAQIRSNTFLIEWPPKSGRQQAFPEVDRGAWFPMVRARQKILEGQLGFLLQLEARLGGGVKNPMTGGLGHDKLGGRGDDSGQRSLFGDQ